MSKTTLASTTTDTNLLTTLAKDKDVYVRWCVTQNPHTPSVVLAGLKKDKNVDVRRGAEANPYTPGYMGKDLAYGENGWFVIE